mgnify:CR=1 FL=1
MNIKTKMCRFFKFSLLLLTGVAALITVSITAKAAFTLNIATSIANSDTQINLNWSSVVDSVYYKVSRNDVTIAIIDVDKERNFLSYSDTDLTPQTSYAYMITAVNPEGKAIQTVTGSAETAQMKAPSIASSFVDLNNNSVTLTWVNNSSAVKSTIVSKLDEGVIATLNSDGTSITFQDPSLGENIRSRYVLMSSDGKGHVSDYSSAVTVTPIKIPTIKASLVDRINTISWDYNSNIQYFVLERSEYKENSWGSWKTISDKIASGSTKTTDTLSGDGTFRYRLSINTESMKGHSNISNPVTRLFAPSELHCVPVGIGRIDLSWVNPAGDDYNLRVERKKKSGTYSTLAVLDSNISTYSDSNNVELETGYTYRITAYNSKSSSASSSEYYIFTGPPLPAYSLNADISSTTKIILNWSDESDNERGFIIERKTDSDSFSKLATVPANVTTYSDGTLTPNNTYTYRVMAYNPFGNADSYTNELSVSTSLLKDPPASLTATAVSTSEIKLTWSYADSASYRTAIERKRSSSESWEIINILPAGFTSYTDVALPANKLYYYRVKGVIGDNLYSRPYPNTESGVSAHTKLLAPQNLKAGWSSTNSIKLEWLDTSYGSEYFIIERKAGDGTFIKVDTQLYDDGCIWYSFDVKPGTDYTFRLKSINGKNSSDYSMEVTVEGIKIMPPSDLKATIVSESEVNLTWNDNSNNETAFIIEQKSGTDNSWNKIGTLNPNSTSYSIKGLKSDTLYTFRVQAYNTAYYTGSLSEECKVSIKALTPPSNLTAKAIASSLINLEWTDNSSGEQGFIIERKSSGNEYTEIARTGSNITKYTDSNLIAGKEYYYRVKAYSGTLYTNYTNIAATYTNAPKTFSDLNSVPWAKKAIENLAGRDIIKGKSIEQNTFAPNDRITRAEFINLVVSGLQFNKTPVGTFEDVKPGHWFYRNVLIAKNMGIVSGIGNNYFYPNEPITREDMAVILTRAMKISGNPFPNHNISILDKFSDKNKISDYALISMAILNGEKIINGKSSTTLAPKDYATRAEAAVILYNTLY